MEGFFVIRKVYLDFIARKLKEDGPGWLVKRGRQYLLLHLSSMMHRPLCGPVHGSLMVTYRCNYNCVMCDMPQKCAERARAGEQELGTDRFRQIIGEFARLGVPGLGFTGGEPMLRPDIYELLACSRQHRMITHLNTNGYFIDDTAAGRLIDIGVDSVNISLDGARAETHDRIRNYSGAFERATGAVERLHRLRSVTGAHIRIKNVAVLDESNIDEAQGLIELSRELGADSIEFIPKQPFDAEGRSVAVSEQFLAKVDQLVEYLLIARQNGALLENSPAHLRLFRLSFAGLPSPVSCRAGYNSLGVDCYGDVFPCFPWISWAKPAGNVRDQSLLKLWHSKEYQQVRNRVSTCRDCFLNCHVELNLLFDLKTRISLQGVRCPR
jgi:MoaA/NifB/PqqE/SkfB family radical SAM enzyme